jgi:hypothetical protein
MVKRYYGGLMTATKVVASATQASGIYNKNIHIQAVRANSWPPATFIDTYVTDPLFSYNALLINSDTPAIPFNADASANNFNISVLADAKASNFSPYYPTGYYSNYFDGSGDGLAISANAAFSFGTGDFTVEFWTYVEVFGSAASTAPTMVAVHNGSTDTGWQLFWNDGAIGIRTYYSNVMNFNVDMTAYRGKWFHIAYVRSSGTQKIYIDGVEKCSTATVWNWTDSSLQIGYTSQDFNGYISNLRLIKGTALYTGAFTPPSAPLTAISGTSLLTCQNNRFIDNSTNNFTITKNGDAKVVAANPFAPVSSYATYGSGYFDGTGDYLAAPTTSNLVFGTGDFCVEMWYYQATNATAGLFSNSVSSGGGDAQFEIQIAATTFYPTVYGWATAFLTSSVASTGGAWNHLVVCRSGSTASMFLNGTRVSTATVTNNFSSTNAFNIGRQAANGTYLTGYISNLRVAKGSSIYDPTASSITRPTEPLTAVSGTQLLTLQNSQPHNNATFLDKSNFKSLVNRFGNTTQGTFTPYGSNWSNYFDGSSFIYPAAGLSAAMGGGFAGNIISFEMWIYPTNFDAGSYGQGLSGAYAAVAANGRWLLSLEKTAAKTSKLKFAYTNSTSSQIDIESTASAINLNKWNHIAITIDATTASNATIKLFANGILLNTFTGQNMSTQTSYYRVAYIGGVSSSFVSEFVGYISNYRILSGVFAYTGNYNIPTSPLTAIPGTVLLTCQSNRFIDNSTNNFGFTLGTSPKVQKFGPTALGYINSYYNPDIYSGAAYFDGSGDYVSLPNSASHAVLPGDFTVECWFYVNTVSGTQTIISHRTANSGSGAYVPFLLWMESAALTLYVSSNNSSWNIVNGTAVGTIAPYQWYHLAYTRTGSTVRVFLNGVQTHTFSTSAAFSTANALQVGMTGPSETGAPLNGYVSDVRITKGTGVYTGNFTPPTTALGYAGSSSIYRSTANINTTFSASNTMVKLDFADAALKDYSLNTFFDFGGEAKITSANSKFGGTSMYFDGSGDYINVLNNQALYSIGTGDFTLEMWVNPISVSSSPVLYDTNPVNNAVGSGRMGMLITSGGVVQVFTLAGTVITQGGAIVANTWNHIAYSRFSNTGNLYVNGLRVTAPVSDTTNYSVGVTYRPAIGINGYDNSSNPMYGYIDDLRLTKGNARYTANFTPTINSFPLR